VARIAVITGGSRGIGAVTAPLLASRGWDVCISYREDADAAARVVHACLNHGGQAIAVPVDLASETDILEMFRRCDEELGVLDVLVNNAGIVGRKSRVDRLDLPRLQEMMAVNVIGPFLCAREAVLRMSALHGGDGGVIVNVSSAASRLGGAGEYVDYAASKGAIDTMTLGLAREVATEGIRVNAVRPGVINTEIHASGGQPDRARIVAPQIPMTRAGEAHEVAAAIAWLCSDEASYTTGALLDVAGGR
jgi:NAD(P)-dependent dehydrogenase (short-subunit alcohol dehydrogenase family)